MGKDFLKPWAKISGERPKYATQSKISGTECGGILVGSVLLAGFERGKGFYGKCSKPLALGGLVSHGRAERGFSRLRNWGAGFRLLIKRILATALVVMPAVAVDLASNLSIRPLGAMDVHISSPGADRFYQFCNFPGI